MKEMISVAPGYQYSVNIAYDLNNDEKLRSFIPTRSSLKLLEAILRSTEVSSTERARILIGAYGKGKSHIVLTILSMLLKKDRNLFEKLTPKIKENSTLYQAVENYYSSPNKILPVIISGSNTSLTQAFLLALERTLSENNLWDVMPETNYKAAINVITRWKNEYPDVFERFNNAIRMPANSFIENLRNYDLDAYNKFEQIYPSLTGGSSFNPFLGFDVIELYESVAKSIREKGYTGLFIVYDEFSKYLESNIASTSVSDTKMLQDFAEKCNRSKTLQMHIMLISHKEISNYIHNGERQKISRKSELTELISRICEQVFCWTPIINNEAINKNEITSMAANSRRKIISGLLRSETEQDLGLVGTGQDVSIMRSTLLRTKILVNHDGFGEINLCPGDKFITNMLSVITEFIENSKYTDQVCFADLYDKLILPAGKIGLRRGIVPIYIAAVFHVYKQQIIIKNKYGQMPVNADSLLQIDANPQQYYLSYINWNASKEEYVKGIENIFIDYIVPAEKATSSYDFVVSAMKRWYLSLPKYTRESQKNADGEPINKKYTVFLRQLRSNNNAYDFLFTKIPDLFGYTTDQLPGLINIILETRKFFDSYLDKLRITLIEFISDLLSTDKSTAHETQIILSNWKNSLDPDVFEQIFTDGTEKFLNLLHEDYVSDEYFISKLTKIASGLRIEDWNDSTLQVFKNQIQNYKQTAESYHKTEILPAVDNPDNNYQVTFVNDDGIPTVKRFEKVEISNRGRLLYNTLTADLDSMGTSISESEKRQILMDVLKKIC